MTKRTATITFATLFLITTLLATFAFGRASAQEDQLTLRQSRVCFEDGFEPNDSVAQAEPVTPGLYTPLFICEGESDYFSIELAQGEQLSVSLLFSDAAGDLELRVTNEVGSVIGSGSSTSDNEAVSVRIGASGTYYIRAYGWTETTEAAYEMVVNVACPDCISYQGQLQSNGGNANGSFEFEFKLYDAGAGGTQVGDTTTQTLTVVDGLFSAELYFGDPNNRAGIYPQHLDIAVRPAGSTGPFTPLAPRTELTAAPTALTLVAGALISGTSTALYVESSGNDGLTVQSAGDDGLYIVDTNDEGIYIANAGETGVWVDNASKAAIVGENSSETFAAGQFVNTNHSVFGGGNGGGIGIYARGKAGTSATDPDASDIVLGATSANSENRTADDGRIASDPGYSSSDLMLASQDKVLVVLDEDINSTGAFFGIYNHGSETADRVFFVQDDGDVFAKSYQINSRSSARDGTPIVQFGTTAMQQRIEDFGTASLDAGSATVMLTENFMRVADTAQAYQLFLTPRGDCPLFVADTAVDRFTIQAMGGATCSIDFDYRVVAQLSEQTEISADLFNEDLDPVELNPARAGEDVEATP